MKRILTAICAFLAVSGATAYSEPYPSRPVTIVVPFGAGGPTDAIARVVAEGMKTPLGQPVSIKYVSGAAGSIGVMEAARAAPDGYTLSIGHWGTHGVNSLIYPQIPEALSKLQPVALLANNPYLILSRHTVQANDLKELIAWIKTRNGAASSPINGPGSAGDLIGALFEQKTHTTLRLVTYKGGTGAAIKDLIGGRLDLMFDQAATSLRLVQAGTAKAYAVAAKTRMAIAQDIPTVDEAGLPGFYMSAWHGLWVPKGTPQAILAKINAAVVASLADPKVRQQLAKMGQEIPPRADQSPAALAAVQKAEIEKWRPIVAAAHLQVH